MSQISEIYEKYYAALFDTDRDSAINIIENACDRGVPPEEIIYEIVIPAINQMVTGVKDLHDITLAQHFIASKVSEEVTERMLPKFSKTVTLQGSIILGTARGDYHGLGKKIVGGCLKANLITVHDLGLNVDPNEFVNTAEANDAQIIGISSMMIHTATGEDGALGVRKILKERKLEDKIKLIVGGAPYKFDSRLYEAVKADGWAPNGSDAVKLVEHFLKGDR